MFQRALDLKLSSLPNVAGGTNWPLTGGVPSQSSVTKDHTVVKVYVAGYQDGSVRIWDATWPALVLLCVLQGEVIYTNVSSAVWGRIIFLSSNF